MAFTPHEAVRNQLAVSWGVEARVAGRTTSTDEMVAEVERHVLELTPDAAGEVVVMVAGTPPGTAGTTNTIRVHRLARR
jgi:pyruvate kinase